MLKTGFWHFMDIYKLMANICLINYLAEPLCPFNTQKLVILCVFLSATWMEVTVNGNGKSNFFFPNLLLTNHTSKLLFHSHTHTAATICIYTAKIMEFVCMSVCLSIWLCVSPCFEVSSWELAWGHSSIPLTQILQLSRNASTTNLMHVTAI